MMKGEVRRQGGMNHHHIITQLNLAVLKVHDGVERSMSRPKRLRVQIEASRIKPCHLQLLKHPTCPRSRGNNPG